MNTADLASLLEYPDPWLRHGLLSAPFFEEQAAMAAEEYGTQTPRGGTEHWRYGGFLYWLRQDLDRTRLQQLLEAAIADPDPPMAGNVIKDITAHRQATAEMVNLASEAVSLNRYYYVRPTELLDLFARSRVTGTDAA